MIAIYVNHIYCSQPNNFSRKMSQKDWVSKSATKTLIFIKSRLDETFCKNYDARGHWGENEMIRKLLLEKFRTSTTTDNDSCLQPMLNICLLNSSFCISNYPTYVLRYVDEKNGKSRIEKFSSGDNGIFLMIAHVYYY